MERSIIFRDFRLIIPTGKLSDLCNNYDTVYKKKEFDIANLVD